MKNNILLFGALFVTAHAFGAAMSPKDMSIKRLHRAHKLYDEFADNNAQLQNLKNHIQAYLQNGPVGERRVLAQEPKLKGAFGKLLLSINGKLQPTPYYPVQRSLNFGQQAILVDDEPTDDVVDLTENFWKMDIE